MMPGWLGNGLSCGFEPLDTFSKAGWLNLNPVKGAG